LHFVRAIFEGKLGQGFSVVDELKEVDIGDGSTPRPTYISARLSKEQKEKVRLLVQEFVDCFSWEYMEMLNLSREVVEHKLPIKQGFKPYKYPARNYNPNLYDQIKEEVDCLLKAEFIRSCRYAEWVSNIVLVEKKNTGKIRMCIDFQNFNMATSKDEYPMPIADSLINNVSGNKAIIFLDGNMGYNHIFMAEEEVSKTAFRCPSFIGLLKWVVMMFGLKMRGQCINAP
jgi:hypothetical protein